MWRLLLDLSANRYRYDSILKMNSKALALYLTQETQYQLRLRRQSMASERHPGFLRLNHFLVYYPGQLIEVAVLPFVTPAH